MKKSICLLNLAVLSLLLTSCAHQSVTLADIQLAQAQLSRPQAETFFWGWKEQALPDAEEFGHWLSAQNTNQLRACICLPPEDPDTALLMQGWQKIKPLIRQSELAGFNVDVELKTTLTGPVIQFQSHHEGDLHGR